MRTIILLALLYGLWYFVTVWKEQGLRVSENGAKREEVIGR